MWRTLLLWSLVSIIAASIYSAIRWGIEDDEELAENDDLIRERMERYRDAGNEVGIDR